LKALLKFNEAIEEQELEDKIEEAVDDGNDQLAQTLIKSKKEFRNTSVEAAQMAEEEHKRFLVQCLGSQSGFNDWRIVQDKMDQENPVKKKLRERKVEDEIGYAA
jgi:hypothetical protein